MKKVEKNGRKVIFKFTTQKSFYIKSKYSHTMCTSILLKNHHPNYISIFSLIKTLCIITTPYYHFWLHITQLHRCGIIYSVISLFLAICKVPRCCNEYFFPGSFLSIWEFFSEMLPRRGMKNYSL